MPRWMGMSGGLRIRRRDPRLRFLDACLNELEEAHERNEVTVSDRLASRIGSHIPDITAGMPIADAIELVFREQEQCLGPEAATARKNVPANPQRDTLTDGDVLEGEIVENVAMLDAGDARALTDRIKAATQQVCMLLLEAHERRAWSVLGYRTWEQYVRQEFGLSRSRSYELLNQGSVIRAIAAAAGGSGIPDISAYAAGQIKPYLPEIVETVRAQIAGAASEDAVQIIADIIRERRARIAAQRRALELSDGSELSDVQDDDGSWAASAERTAELTRLYEAVDQLANMPPVDDAIARLSEDAALRLAGLDAALQWLTGFANELEAQHAPWANAADALATT
jgi:hypothetical protein